MHVKLIKLIYSFFTIFFLTLVFPSVCHAVTYYASPNGSGSSCAASTSACSLNTGLGKLNAGDTLYLLGGTYNQLLSFDTNGSETARITIAGYPGQTAVINGNNTIPSGLYDYLVTISGSYVTLQNLTVTNSHFGGITVDGDYSYLIHVTMANSGVSGVVFTGNGNLGDYVDVSGNGREYGDESSTWGSALCTVGQNTIIRHSASHNNKGEGMNAYHGAVNALFEDNVVYNNDAVGIYIDSSSNGTFQRNFIYYTTNASSCFEFGQEYSNSLYNNKVINNITYGCWASINNYLVGDLRDTIIANNTFYITANSGAEANIILDGMSFTNSSFVNNIVFNENTVPLFISDTRSGLTLSHNLWSRSPGFSGTGDVISNNPLFAKTGSSTSAEWFKLTVGSPAIGAGTALSEVTQDYFGNARDNPPDIGVHEYGASGATSTPTPTPSVVCLGADLTINADDLTAWVKSYSSINNVLKFAELITHWGEACQR